MGNPLHFKEVKLNREKLLNKSIRQYISINDATLWEQIEELYPYYTTFNKLVNDALKLGVPALIKQKTSPITLADETTDQPQEKEIVYEVIPDPRIDKVVSLLAEIAMNTTLNKYMLSGLFNAEVESLEKSSPMLSDRLSRGLLNHTPDCLDDLEIEMLKDMYKEDDNDD